MGLQSSLGAHCQTTARAVGMVRKKRLAASNESAPLWPFPTKTNNLGRCGMVRSSRISRSAESATASPARLMTSH